MLAFQPNPDGPFPQFQFPPLKWPPRNEYLPWPLPFDEPLRLRVEEATPRILVVTDGDLRFSSTSGFGLSQFVDTLRASKVHGMTPIVDTAHRGSDASAGKSQFKFDSSVTKGKYDVIFLFGFERASTGTGPGTAGNLPETELDVLVQFMQAGGGLFATGDHENLGAAMSGNLPRVRAMRHWYLPGAPAAASAKRITTNSPGDNGIFEFDDQSDAIPQRIYPRYFTATRDAFASAPHAVLQAPRGFGPFRSYVPIEVAPDHAHEGECLEPTNLATIFPVGGKNFDEWPVSPGTTTRPAPQSVAYGMTYGGAIRAFSKQAVFAPRAFGVIGVYDGHAANVGRVAVDSTWHHFVNINIDGTSKGMSGLREIDPANPAAMRDTPELTLIRRYWGNLANWLMPEHVRLRIVWARLLHALRQPQMREELAGWPKDSPRRKQTAALAELASATTASLAFASTPAETAQILDDLTALTLGKDALSAVRELESDDDSSPLEASAATELRQAALAGTVLALLDLAEPGHDIVDAIEVKGGLRGLGEIAAPQARARASDAIANLRKRTRRLEQGLDKLAPVPR